MFSHLLDLKDNSSLKDKALFHTTELSVWMLLQVPNFHPVQSMKMILGVTKSPRRGLPGAALRLSFLGRVVWG